MHKITNGSKLNSPVLYSKSSNGILLISTSVIEIMPLNLQYLACLPNTEDDHRLLWIQENHRVITKDDLRVLLGF